MNVKSISASGYVGMLSVLIPIFSGGALLIYTLCAILFKFEPDVRWGLTVLATTLLVFISRFAWALGYEAGMKKAKEMREDVFS